MLRCIVLVLCVLAFRSTALAQAGIDFMFSAPLGAHIVGVTPAADGSMYIVASGGGPLNLGALIKRSPDGHISLLHSFAGPDGGAPRAALTFGADGELYGTTSSGGLSSLGTIFRLTRDGAFSSLHDFTAEEGGPSRAPLRLAADGGLLGVTYGSYGISCTHGGSLCELFYYDTGAVFELSAAGQLNILHKGLFMPGGGVTEASSGDLFILKPKQDLIAGMPEQLAPGGIYRLRPDGQISFHLTSPSELFNPSRELLAAPDGLLYGMTGGVPGVFRIDPASDRADFGYQALAAEGQPAGGLALGSEGNLYGIGNGFFRLSQSGDLLHLRDAVPQPTAALARAGQDGFAYGSGDNLLELKESGALNELRRFGLESGALLSALHITRNGAVYGSTFEGGMYGYGTLFRADDCNPITALHHFAARGNAPPLRTPLVETADGSLYAITGDESPALIRVDANNKVTTLHTFASPGIEWTGWFQNNEYLTADHGSLYGSISLPSDNGDPSVTSQIFRFDLQTRELHVIATSTELGPLLRAASGNFVGIELGANGYELFRLTPTGERSLLHVFSSLPSGHYPTSNLVQAADGSLYGFARGNDNLSHVIYRWTRAGKVEIVYRYPRGQAPRDYFVQLLLGPSGELYVTSPSTWWPEQDAQSAVLRQGGQLQALTGRSLGLIKGPSGAIYRVTPLTQHGYRGFRVDPLAP